MEADLCRKLALVFSSPGFLDRLSTNVDDPQEQRHAIEKLCIEAKTEAALPDRIKKFFDFCTKSIEVADSLDMKYPYTPKQVEKVMEAMMEDDNADS
jgi:hypothetical protein